MWAVGWGESKREKGKREKRKKRKRGKRRRGEKRKEKKSRNATFIVVVNAPKQLYVALSGAACGDGMMDGLFGPGVCEVRAR